MALSPYVSVLMAVHTYFSRLARRPWVRADSQSNNRQIRAEGRGTSPLPRRCLAVTPLIADQRGDGEATARQRRGPREGPVQRWRNRRQQARLFEAPSWVWSGRRGAGNRPRARARTLCQGESNTPGTGYYYSPFAKSYTLMDVPPGFRASGLGWLRGTPR